MSGFVTISSTAPAAPTSAGRELSAAPAGDDPEEDLGEADVAHGAGDRAEVAVERDLETAADGGAVDRGEGGEGQSRGSPPNASCPACRARRASSGVVICGNSVRSAPAAKTNGLPVSTSPLPVAFAQARERGRASDASAARPNTFGFCQSSPLSIVTRAIGPMRVRSPAGGTASAGQPWRLPPAKGRNVRSAFDRV